MEIEFVDDLPPTRMGLRERSRLLREFADGLRANPDRWAKYPTPLAPGSTYTRASQINAGVLATFPAEQFKARSEKGVLYVKAVVADV